MIHPDDDVLFIASSRTHCHRFGVVSESDPVREVRLYTIPFSLLCTYNEQVASKPTPLTSEGDIPVVDSTDLTQVQIDFHIYTNQSSVLLLLILPSVCLDTSSEDCS